MLPGVQNKAANQDGPSSSGSFEFSAEQTDMEQVCKVLDVYAPYRGFLLRIMGYDGIPASRHSSSL